MQAMGNRIVSMQPPHAGNSAGDPEGPRGKSLMWIEQDVEPLLPPRASKVQGTVRSILKGITRHEMIKFLEV